MRTGQPAPWVERGPDKEFCHRIGRWYDNGLENSPVPEKEAMAQGNTYAQKSPQFIEHYVDLLRSRLTVGLAAGTVLVLAFIISDAIFLRAHFQWLLVLRLATAVLLGLILLLNRMVRARWWQECLAWLAVAVVALMVEAMILRLGSGGLPYLGMLHLVLIGGLVLIPVRLGMGVLIAASVLAIFVVPYLSAASAFHPEDFFRHLNLLIAGAVLLLIANHLHGKAVLSQFSMAGVLRERESRLKQQALALDRLARRRGDNLRQSEQRYRSLVESAPQLIYTLDLNGAFTFVGPRLEPLTGYQPSEVLGRPLLDLVFSEDRKIMKRVLAQVRDDSQAVGDVEFRIQLKGGGASLFSSYTAPLLGVAGNLEGMIGTAMDVTESVRIAGEREEYRRSLEAALQQLKDSIFDTVKALAGAIEAKDSYTRGHADRVRLLCSAMAARMGFSPEDLTRLEYAAALHDVGKIGVSGALLNKKGSLTGEEYERVKQHPVLGEAILRDVEMLGEVRLLVRSHHERIDGRGYPDGLAGRDIPLAARIMAVADAFDAMRSRRPYRDPLGRSEVLDTLRRESGTQFDGDVVKVFLEVAMDQEVMDEWSGLLDDTGEHDAVETSEGPKAATGS